MPRSPAPDEYAEEREERLAVVLDRLLNDSTISCSSAESLDRAIREHPDLEADIRELYSTAMIASDVAMFQSAEVSRILNG